MLAAIKHILNLIMKKMKCIVIEDGKNENQLRLGKINIPEVTSQEVLIRILYSGVNRPDILQRQGKYKPPRDASPVLGLEAAGEIVKVGHSVTKWKVGDLVTALLHGGGYAEFAVANQHHCLRIPNGLTLAEAGSLCENYFTVWSNLFSRGKLKAGEHVLIHGGTSGIGIAAIQLAHRFGATVWATAGSDKKCDFCREIGAELAINYKREDFHRFFLNRRESISLDIILDMVGGDYISKNLDILGEDGRLIFIAFLNGSIEKINFSKVMIKRLTLLGSTLRPQSLFAKARIAESLEYNIWPLFEHKKLLPVIDSVYNLSNAGLAHERMESSKHIGKIMLKVSD